MRRATEDPQVRRTSRVNVQNLSSRPTPDVSARDPMRSASGGIDSPCRLSRDPSARLGRHAQFGDEADDLQDHEGAYSGPGNGHARADDLRHHRPGLPSIRPGEPPAMLRDDRERGGGNTPVASRP